MTSPVSPRHALSIRLAVALVLLLAASAATAAKEREGEAALHAVLKAEEGLLEAARQAWRSNVAAQQSAAAALARAATALGAAMDGAAGLAAASTPASGEDAGRSALGVAIQQSLVNAQLAHADAREVLERLLAESSRIEGQLADRAARVDALRDGLERLRRTLPPRGAAEGGWIVALAPFPDPLTFRMSQEGQFVSGTVEAAGVPSGSVSGRCAGGQIRLERFDAGGVKIADLAGELASNGEFHGTWQSTILGSGLPEAGTFVARPVPADP